MKWTLTVASLVTLAVALFAGWYGFQGVLTAGLIGFAFLLFAANLDRISEFRAGSTGVEAKTREVLDRAEHTVSELQSLAAIVATTTLSLIKRSGRMGGYDDEEAERIRAEVLGVLSQIGVSEPQKTDALRDWHRLTKFDYVLYILGHSRIPEGFDDPTIHAEWKKLRSFEDIASPKLLRVFLAKWNLLTPEREEYLKDYEHYLAHEKHRRPDVWKKRESWGHLKSL